jgi:hypothetical protein
MTVRAIVDCICNTLASGLFYSIETIITPHIAVEGTIEDLFWFFTTLLLISNLILAILQSFTNYRSIIFKTTTGHCSSGRHGRRGRNNDQHNTWWHGSSYNRKKHYNKEDSPKTKRRKELGKKERQIRRKIDLLQYFDPIIMPSNMFVIDDDAFCDARSVYYGFFHDERNDLHQVQKWIYPDTMPTLAITTKTIKLLVDSIDVLSHYHDILSFEDVSFFNTSYHRLDHSSPLFESLLIQARHLRAQVFQYDTTLNNCTDDTLEIYVSSCSKELPIVIDTGASGSITPIASDFVNGIHKADLQSLNQVNGKTPVCGQGLVKWPIEDVNGTR